MKRIPQEYMNLYALRVQNEDMRASEANDKTLKDMREDSSILKVLLSESGDSNIDHLAERIISLCGGAA